MAIHPGNSQWTRDLLRAKWSPPKQNFTVEDIGKSSLTWPSTWRKVVSKIEVVRSEYERVTKLIVFPRNPEWDKAMQGTDIDLLKSMPSPYLDPGEFTTIEDVDAWVKLINRME